MGTSTIRKENWAMTSRFTPLIRPTAMVVPDRDRPGATAQAWPRPTTKACRKEMPLRLSRGQTWNHRPKWSEKNSRAAVTSRQTATVVRFSPKRLSTWSLKNMPTTKTGIIETQILAI